MSTPAMPPLVVSVSDIARRLGLPLPLNEHDRWVLESAVRDAQADVESYLGRPVTPATYTEYGLIPRWDGRWDLTHQPVIHVISATPEVFDGTATGRYTVVYTAGLDAEHDPELEPIRRFVREHAMHSELARALAGRVNVDAGRRVAAVTVEGQSITYQNDAEMFGGPGQVGALPQMSTLDRWRVRARRVHQADTLPHVRGRYCSGQWWA